MFIQPLDQDETVLETTHESKLQADDCLSAIVVAIDENNAIGNKNRLLCKLPKDMEHFKKLTEGGIVIMGRNTYDSLPKKPLSNRENIVITSNSYPKHFPGCMISSSLDWLWEHTKQKKQKLFFIGGAKLYEAVIGKVDKLFVTKIHHQFRNADTFFLGIDPKVWELVAEEYHPSDKLHPYAFSFLEYKKRENALV